MSVIMKTKEKEEKATLKELGFESGEMVDALGSLRAEASAIMANPIFKQIKNLEIEIKALADGVDASDDLVVEGEHYRANISRCRNVRTIKDIVRAAELMGESVFIKLATVPMKAIDLHLTKKEQQEVIAEDFSGSRSLKIEKV